MHIYLGADHRGIVLKSSVVAWLQTRQIPFTDFGASQFNCEDDYNDYARKVTTALLAEDKPEDSFGVLLCGSGQGMCMQANRFKGIRAALCRNSAEALEARGHNDANVLCISADENGRDFSTILDTFFSASPLPDPKYARRNQKLDED